MESWRHVWREGFAPQISTDGLTALLKALEADDPRLQQGSTTTPAPLMCVQDWPVEAACCLGFCGWQGDGLTTVGEVEEYFARLCFQADQALGEPAACRWFLNWFDDTPRAEMRRELAHEVTLVLLARGSVSGALGGDVPDGFAVALVNSDYKDAAAFGALADWLDDHDRPEAAHSVRQAGKERGL
jgi:hypothetical protein